MLKIEKMLWEFRCGVYKSCLQYEQTVLMFGASFKLLIIKGSATISFLLSPGLSENIENIMKAQYWVHVLS